jgi:hypothetical protein
VLVDGAPDGYEKAVIVYRGIAANGDVVRVEKRDEPGSHFSNPVSCGLQQRKSRGVPFQAGPENIIHG